MGGQGLKDVLQDLCSSDKLTTGESSKQQLPERGQDKLACCRWHHYLPLTRQQDLLWQSNQANCCMRLHAVVINYQLVQFADSATNS